jgi:hypothetical protein
LAEVSVSDTPRRVVGFQVAFAGHNRAADLGDTLALTRALHRVFRGLKDAGMPTARLLSGLAPGADQLAAKAWRRAKLGPIHAIYPFLAEAAIALGDSATWLDGQAARRAGHNPHLAQTRLLLSHADLLVVIWAGGAARGAGGTADAVRLALEAGLPVLWIQPGSPNVRLIGAVDQMSLGAAELMEMPYRAAKPIDRMAPQDLARALGLSPDVAPEAEQEDTQRQRDLDRWLHRWLWRTFALFQRLAGGRMPPGPAPLEPPADLAVQPGFQRLDQAYEAADRRATKLAAVHRSEQVLLLLAAVVAAVIGSAPAVWPSLNLFSVIMELAFGLAALAVWLTASHARRHTRWTEARRLAEQLRMERVAWALGVAAGSGAMARRRERELPPALLHQVPPAAGAYDAGRVSSWGAWAMDVLVTSQLRYHRNQMLRNRRIAHRIHVTEDGAFVILLCTLAAFAAALVLEQPLGFTLAPWIGGIVLMTSVIVPAIGAASIALEAKLEFEEQAERSADLAGRLDELIAAVPENPNLATLQAAARMAIDMLLAEADQWREGARRRQLTRGS